MRPSQPSGCIGAYLPWGKKLRLPFDKLLRRSHRLYRSFPVLPYKHFLDVGAYRGEFAESVAAYFQPERVWMVEADPDQAAFLRAKFVGRGNFQVIQAAISDASGQAQFRVNKHRPSSSIVPISPLSGEVFQLDMREEETILMPALSLDDLFTRENLPEIDLMKVDIQGAERLLIQGGGAALHRIRAVYIEVLFQECYQGCALFCEIHESLGACGFKLWSMHDFRRGADGHLVYANALYHRQQ